MKKPAKKKFEVEAGETIDACINRMMKEGYSPVRRIEEPIFIEIDRNGSTEIEPYGRKIIFEGRLS